jgi:type IV pilus assembly protein PilE
MKSKGITLIELLFTISIIAIMGTLIYPSFNHLLTEHHRQQAEQTLLIMAKNMEVYKIQTKEHSYLGVTIDDVIPANLPIDTHYHYLISKITADTFQLTAEPSAQQLARDQECGTLTLNQLGVRGSANISKPNNCWHS